MELFYFGIVLLCGIGGLFVYNFRNWRQLEGMLMGALGVILLITTKF